MKNHFKEGKDEFTIVLLLVFADKDYKVRMMYLNSNNNRWYDGINFGGSDINSDVWNKDIFSDKKFGFEWVNDSGIYSKGGRFYLMYRD
ncbi:MAG: hypothetical protein ACP5QK_04810 [Myxococcota bacterium]